MLSVKCAVIQEDVKCFLEYAVVSTFNVVNPFNVFFKENQWMKTTHLNIFWMKTKTTQHLLESFDFIHKAE